MIPSYHNDPQLKADLVAEMRWHQEHDRLIKGLYNSGHDEDYFHGCHVGCAVRSLNLRRGLSIKYSDHQGLARASGIPEWLWWVNDFLYEALPKPSNVSFAVDVLEAIPVGANLDQVKWQFNIYNLQQAFTVVQGLDIDDGLKSQVLHAIQGSMAVNQTAIETGVCHPGAARAAWAAARVAAWAAAAAARAAAWAAAWAAARDAAAEAAAARNAASAAARDAARDAVWVTEEQAQQLIKMLKEAK